MQKSTDGQCFKEEKEMKKRFLRNILVAVSGMSLAVVMAFSLNITSYASEVVVIDEEGSEDEIQPRQAIIDWRFKIEDGKLYRRLYNYTEQCWVGEWELFGNYD